jgi:hypothetical protein
MEVFAILTGIAAAPVVTGVYCFLLSRLKVSTWRIAPYLRISSMIILGLFAVEVLMLTTVGAVRSRALLGRAFEIAQVVLFLTGVPALANLLVLRRGNTRVAWSMAMLPCAALAVVLLFLQYSVSEALYGVDGQGGPYSSAHDVESRQ